MISAQVIKTSIEELKDITKIELNIYDISGNVVAATDPDNIIDMSLISDFANSPVDSQVIGNSHLMKIMDEEELLYILIASGVSDSVYTVGRICVSEIQNLIIAYKERYDRNNFFQNLLLDNLLLIDIYNRAKKLHIDVNLRRVIILVETNADKDTSASEMLASIYSTQSGDYVTAVDADNVILIKSLKADEDYETAEKCATTIVDMMNTELMMNVHVAYGTIVSELKDLSKSFKEAKMALEVGKIFYADRKVSAYNTLGIGRLIYQLPINLCKVFLDEVFDGKNVIDDLDEETLNTINEFFDNSLNVSETSRQLFVHRNTLVYRIEKLSRTTGLDIRKFDDALTFKIALMVSNFMKYLDTHEY